MSIRGAYLVVPLLLACGGFASERDDDVVTGVVEVNDRVVPARAWCPERLGDGGETWMLALSDERWDVAAVGVRAGPLDQPMIGVYQAAKGSFPQGHPNDHGVVEVGTEPCVEVTWDGTAGRMRFECAGTAVGVEYPGDHETLSIRGDLEFRNCPFP